MLDSSIYVFILAGVAIYLFPSILALLRRNRDSYQIFVLNFYLGWTVLGWLTALEWAWDDGLKKAGTIEPLAGKKLKVTAAGITLSAPHNNPSEDLVHRRG